MTYKHTTDAQHELRLARARQLRQQAPNTEHFVWAMLRGSRLGGYKFRRQESIGNYFVDFVCYSQRLIVELDGAQHAQQQKYDENRTAWLNRQGFRVIRFTNDEVRDAWPAAEREILRQLRCCPLTPGPSPAEGEGSQDVAARRGASASLRDEPGARLAAAVDRVAGGAPVVAQAPSPPAPLPPRERGASASLRDEPAGDFAVFAAAESEPAADDRVQAADDREPAAEGCEPDEYRDHARVPQGRISSPLPVAGEGPGVRGQRRQPAPASSQPPLSRGISLLEVLISMFVLTIGLLSLASMVPVGQFQVQQATNAYAAASTGRSAGFGDLKVRGLLNPASWVYMSSASAYLPAFEAFQDADGDNTWDSGELFVDLNKNNTRDAPAPFMANLERSAFLIDGLAVATNAGNSIYRYFPPGGTEYFFASKPVLRLDRITTLDMGMYAAWPGGAGSDPTMNTTLSLEAADRIFRSVDDKEFELLPDEIQRPVLVNSNLSAQAQSRGDISWMVMVQPAIHWNTNTTPPTAQPIPGLGTTTVVVFHKRDLTRGATPAPERAVWADLDSCGPGSLDVELRADASDGINSLLLAKPFLKVRPNQWVMLSCQVAAQGVWPARTIHRWYRVVVAGEVELDTSSGAYTCDVSLSGIDASTSTALSLLDADGDPSTGSPFNSTPGMTFVCTICDGAIGVFEKTVQSTAR